MPLPHLSRQGLLLAIVFLSACATRPTDDNYAHQANLVTQQVSAWQQLDDARSATFLNELIQSRQLDELLALAYQANPNLQRMLLTLEIRRAEQQQSGADRLPIVTGSFSAEKAEDSDPTYRSSITIGWEVDLWQKLANGVNAAELDLFEQQALTQATQDSLAAEVMQIWLGLIAQQHQISIEQRRLQAQEKNAGFILQRYRNGLGKLEDLDSARSAVASTRANLEALRENYQQQQRSLQALLGQNEAIDLSLSTEYPDVQLTLADLPAQTLQRRPDLKAAYIAIQSADQRTNAAYKDLLPSISLQASLQDEGNSPRAALLNNPLWTLLGQLTAPLYQGGQLRAAAEIARLNTAMAYQTYRETLHSAVNEVEDALGLERSLRLRQQHIETAFSAARNNYDQYLKSYRTGLTSILDLLSVEQQTYDLEAQLDNLIYLRLINRIDLGLALGLGVNTSSTAVAVAQSSPSQ